MVGIILIASVIMDMRMSTQYNSHETNHSVLFDWSKACMPSKIFAASSFIFLQGEFVAELHLFYSNREAFDAEGMSHGFFIRLMLSILLTIVICMLHMVSIQALYTCELHMFAWLYCVLPFAYLLANLGYHNFMRSLTITIRGEVIRSTLDRFHTNYE